MNQTLNIILYVLALPLVLAGLVAFAGLLTTDMNALTKFLGLTFNALTPIVAGCAIIVKLVLSFKDEEYE